MSASFLQVSRSTPATYSNPEKAVNTSEVSGNAIGSPYPSRPSPLRLPFKSDLDQTPMPVGSAFSVDDKRLGKDPWRHASPKEDILGHWEGRVTGISNEAFTALLADMLGGQRGENLEAEIPLNEVSASDRDLLKEGALFGWIIGMKYSGSTLERSSRIVFRRLPAWSKREIAHADAAAETLWSSLIFE